MVITSEIKKLIELAFEEDLSNCGDYSSQASIPEDATSKARLFVKDDGILAGVELAEYIFKNYDSSIQFEKKIDDGQVVKYGDVAFYVFGRSRTLLSVERIVLNFMQRMSGIATLTHEYVEQVKGTGVKLLDTRKTTPGLRHIEKWAVRIGGGHNHRMGLYDMIMLKDNHIDYAGGIQQAIKATNKYLKDNELNVPIEIETRNIDEVRQVLEIGGVQRIMLDNFSPNEIRDVIQLIPSEFETEASGGITRETLSSYAETGVNYISIGALTHSYKSLDLSLKAVK